jgi:lysophospholipid acyltransferase (LPLAT)-like uncharacterized protein
METNPDSEERSGLTLWQSIQLRAISFVGWLLVWLIGTTIKFRFEDHESLDQFRRRRQPVIFSFWHNQIFCQTYLFRFQQIVVMTSRHFDGEYIGRIIEKFGYGTARGSSTRGAVRALLELKRHLAQGRDVAFTVDGPKGPAYEVKPGPVFLARKSGAPLITLHSEPEAFWELRSWDRFRIPKPFTRALVKFGRPIYISAEEGEDSGVARYQNEMDRIKLYCESWKLNRTI